MERHIDYLSFISGGKMTVPFEAFLIFSTNLNPNQLGDEAFLRRIQYKMFLRSPRKNEFLEIFHRVVAAAGLDCHPTSASATHSGGASSSVNFGYRVTAVDACGAESAD